MFNKNTKISTTALVISNFILLWSVMNHGIGVLTLMFVYWSENIITGLFNTLKMMIAQEDFASNNAQSGIIVVKYFFGRWPRIIFFIFGYGVFTIVQGTAILLLASFYEINFNVAWYGVVAIFLSHMISYLVNFIGMKEFKMITVGHLVYLSKKRLFILHVSIMFGGLALISLNNSLLLMALFVIFKTIVDLFFHIMEHKFPKAALEK